MLDLDEAVRCREAGWGGPILLLEGFFEPADLDIVDRYHLSTSVHHREQLDMLARRAKVDIMLKLNSGMNRLGFSPAAYPAAFERAQLLQQQGVLGSVGKMTHFACADGPQGVNEQLGLFNSVTQIPGRGQRLQFRRCVSRKSPSVPRPRRTGCGRASACTAPRPSPTRTRPPSACGLPSRCVPRSSRCRNSRPAIRSATAPFSAPSAPCASASWLCGYADGYPRHASTGTPSWWQACALVGRVSMDMLMVDLDPVPAAGVGSPVSLWGEDGPSVDEVAQAAGTIGYELLCAVAPRVPVIREP